VDDEVRFEIENQELRFERGGGTIAQQGAASFFVRTTFPLLGFYGNAQRERKSGDLKR
jgi:hypothetical protein